MPLPAKNQPALVYCLLLAEALLFTYARGKLGPYASAVALLGCSGAACAAAYGYLRHRAWPRHAPAGRPRQYGAIALACGLGVAVCGLRWHKILGEFEVQISNSDIIPSLSIYTRRWLAGRGSVPVLRQRNRVRAVSDLPARHLGPLRGAPGAGL